MPIGCDALPCGTGRWVGVTIARTTPTGCGLIRSHCPSGDESLALMPGLGLASAASMDDVAQTKSGM